LNGINLILNKKTRMSDRKKHVKINLIFKYFLINEKLNKKKANEQYPKPKSPFTIEILKIDFPETNDSSGGTIPPHI
jgi:hypothetical protein